METQNGEVHVDSDEARAGSSTHVTRYVLGIGLVLVIAAFIAIVMIGSAGANHENNGVDNSARAAASEKAKEAAAP